MTGGNLGESAPSLSAFGLDPEVHAAARLGMGPRIPGSSPGQASPRTEVFFSSPVKTGVQSRVRGAG